MRILIHQFAKIPGDPSKVLDGKYLMVIENFHVSLIYYLDADLQDSNLEKLSDCQSDYTYSHFHVSGFVMFSSLLENFRDRQLFSPFQFMLFMKLILNLNSPEIITIQIIMNGDRFVSEICPIDIRGKFFYHCDHQAMKPGMIL